MIGNSNFPSLSKKDTFFFFKEVVLMVGEWKTTLSIYILIIKKVEKENGEQEEPTSIRQETP